MATLSVCVYVVCMDFLLRGIGGREGGREGSNEEWDLRFEHCKYKQDNKEQENGYHCRKAIIVLARRRAVVLNVSGLCVEARQRALIGKSVLMPRQLLSKPTLW